MQSKSMMDIFKMSFKYTISNKKAILVLGIIIVLNEVATITANEFNHELSIIATIAMVVLYLYFVGFIAYFVEEVISDPSNPPKSNSKMILRMGLREFIFFTFYIALSGIAYSIFNWILNVYPTYEHQIIVIMVFTTSFLSLFPMAAMINVFLHDKNVKYGFKIREIANMIFNLRCSKFICIVIISLFVENLFVSNFTNYGGAYQLNIVNLIINLVIIPFLYIFLQFVNTIAILISNDNKYRGELLARK